MSGDLDDKQMKTTHQEIEFRQRAKRNMWITISVVGFCVTYVGLYSLTLYVGPEDKCNISDSKWVHSISTALERQIQYILWLYPLLWLFWPAEASCQCGKKSKVKESVLTSHVSVETPMSINSKQVKDDDLESDGDDQFDGQGTVQTFLKKYEQPMNGQGGMQFVLNKNANIANNMSSNLNRNSSHLTSNVSTTDHVSFYQRRTFRAS